MKKLLFIAAVFAAFSCDAPKDPNTTIDGLPLSEDSATNGLYKTNEATNKVPAPSQEGIECSYVGDFEAVNSKPERIYFYKNKINISVDSIRDAKVFGHSVVAGNQRPFSGSCELKDGVYSITATEPGDDKYDGKFIFNLDANNLTVEGTWKANNPKLEVNERKYKLKKATFIYNVDNVLPSTLSGEIVSQWNELSKLEESAGEGEMITADAMKINASTEKLKKENVENMYKGDLELMRNAIYARHGYSFKNRKMRYIFDNLVDWYIPYATDVRNDLTVLEKENIALIKRYEEHASRYYDSYGR